MVSIQLAGVIALIGATALTLHGCGGCDIDYKDVEKTGMFPDTYNGMIDKCTLSVSGMSGKCCDKLKKGEGCEADDLKKISSVSITMTGKSSSPVKKASASIDVDPEAKPSMSSTMLMNNLKEAVSTAFHTQEEIFHVAQAETAIAEAKQEKAVETNMAGLQAVPGKAFAFANQLVLGITNSTAKPAIADAKQETAVETPMSVLLTMPHTAFAAAHQLASAFQGKVDQQTSETESEGKHSAPNALMILAALGAVGLLASVVVHGRRRRAAARSLEAVQAPARTAELAKVPETTATAA